MFYLSRLPRLPDILDSMPLVRLISWNRDDVEEHARALKKSGFSVNADPQPTRRFIGHFRDLAPAAILIDLDKRPAHGRIVGIVLLSNKSTGGIPMVFAGGPAEKIDGMRK